MLVPGSFEAATNSTSRCICLSPIRSVTFNAVADDRAEITTCLPRKSGYAEEMIVL